MRTSSGTISPARNRTKTMSRPGKRSRAKAKAANALVATWPAVMAIVMANVLPMMPGLNTPSTSDGVNGRLRVNTVKLAKVAGSGIHCGGYAKIPRSVLNAADSIQPNGPIISTATISNAPYVTPMRTSGLVIGHPNTLQPVLGQRQSQYQHERRGRNRRRVADLKELKGIVDDVLDQGLCAVIRTTLRHHYHWIEHVQGVDQSGNDNEERRR